MFCYFAASISQKELWAKEEQNARSKVTEYCRHEKMTQKAFGEMIDLSDNHGGAIGRFMCGKSGSAGKAYPAVVAFFKTYDV